MHCLCIFSVTVLKHLLPFSAVRYALPIQKSAIFYFNSTGLLSCHIRCPSRRISILMYRDSHSIYIILISGSTLQRLTATPILSLYSYPCITLCTEPFQCSDTTSQGFLPLSINSLSLSQLFSSFPSTFPFLQLPRSLN